ncbi:PLD nuclease N-terminal domain-containing protein [Gryllotalpicola koreensis]|uniref:Cardiolipin synthase N-terminal domain-containing protein n=1 Tax=Gryllotalpicola koreensis TaxID=993086 RepID=A0ABP8ACL7_9MICO
MFRLWLVIGFLAAVFYVYSIVSVCLADRLGVRGLPKAAWVAVVVIFPIIGAVLWLTVGRADGPRGGRMIAPDDDAEFLSTLGDHPKKPGDGPNG